MMGNYLFIFPALAMFLTFSIYPYYDVFRLSFIQWDGIGAESLPKSSFS